MEKFNTMLFKPKYIAFYIKDNIFMTILSLFLFLIIALIPSFIIVVTNDEISSDFREEASNIMLLNRNETAYINNYVLYFEEANTYRISAFDIVIGQAEDSADSMMRSKYIFSSDRIQFVISNIVVYEVTYEQLNLEQLSFNLVCNGNFDETNKFLSTFNYIYKDNHSYIATYNIFFIFFQYVVLVITSSLMITFLTYLFSSIVNNNMPFLYRFKTALLCQYVYIVSILLGGLYRVELIELLGNGLSCIYMMIAMKSVIVTRKGL